MCACWYVCLHCKYADLESLKQIRFVHRVLAHKAAELGLRVWVVDGCLQWAVGEPKQAHPTRRLRLKILISEYTQTVTSSHVFLVLYTFLH